MPRPQPLRFAAPLVVPAIALAALLALPAAAPRTAGAQQAQFEWPAHPKNLKVLPKSTTPDQLRETMVGFTQSLGVRCPYCHVGEEGKPLTTFDFSSDAKPTKQIARDMVRMMGDIHKDLGRMRLSSGVPRVNVRCITCHHGHARPTTLTEELMVTYDRAGIDSTLDAYQKLKGRYFGRDAYDFSENGLADFGAELQKKGRADDAIRVHQLNVQQYPTSMRAYGALEQAYETAGRKQEAIDTYHKMLDMDPSNSNIQRRLHELEGSGK
ncbi:MAG TPA: c-type cytochrome [Candidatus Binatia bacterium]|nr:c-type cytochrome [Candidatus Binatia bacterium]